MASVSRSPRPSCSARRRLPRYFVAHASEGARARAVPLRKYKIYVLNGLETEADPAADYAAQNLAPVIGSPIELAAVGPLCGRPAAAALGAAP